jgi:hypothetical protein
MLVLLPVVVVVAVLVVLPSLSAETHHSRSR